MRTVRPRLAALAALALAAASLATASPASAADSLTVSLDRVNIVNHRPTDFLDRLGNTVSGASESLLATITVGGVDEGDGVAHETGNGGTESFDIPVALNIGTINNGDHALAMITDTQLDGGLDVVANTFSFTCHLNSSGTGACN
ncbi:hypothetical protein ACPCTO_23115 [Streptomyces olivoreticuli]